MQNNFEGVQMWSFRRQEYFLWTKNRTHIEGHEELNIIKSYGIKCETDTLRIVNA